MFLLNTCGPFPIFHRKSKESMIQGDWLHPNGFFFSFQGERKSLWTLILTTIVVKITGKPKKKAFSVPPELRINHDMGVVAPPKSAKNNDIGVFCALSVNLARPVYTFAYSAIPSIWPALCIPQPSRIVPLGRPICPHIQPPPQLQCLI